MPEAAARLLDDRGRQRRSRISGNGDREPSASLERDREVRRLDFDASIFDANLEGHSGEQSRLEAGFLRNHQAAG